MRDNNDQANFEAQLEILNRQFVDAEVRGETDADIGKALVDYILKSERLRRGVDINGHVDVDQETFDKLANCTDSDNSLIASTVGLAFERLAEGKRESAVKLLKNAIEAKQREFNKQQRAKAKMPRKKNPITIFIEQIVEKNPNVKLKELRSKLEQMGEDITFFYIENDEFVPLDDSHAPIKISGLKDQLYRAKKALKKSSSH